MSKRIRFEAIRVNSPCGEEWSEMAGNDKIRFCSHCAKDVNDLSSITRKQAKRLVAASNGNLCIRYIEHPVTRRPIFADQLHQITRRAPGIAAGVMTASMSLATIAYSQGGTVPKPSEATTTIATVDAADQVYGSGTLSGTVVDQNGAVIVNARVTLTESRGIRTTYTDSEGSYRFEKLDPRNYLLEVAADGFKTGGREIAIPAASRITADESLGIELILMVDIVSEVEIATHVSGGIGFVEYSTALAKAVASEDVESVRELIANGADVNVKEEKHDRITPLFTAVDDGNIEIVHMLLNAGAKANIRSDDKSTPLMQLDGDASPELVLLLIRYGAKVNVANTDGETALVLATASASPEVIRALIDVGADVNAADSEGVTALMRAAERDSAEIVRTLLEAGASVNARDKEDDIAWDYASGEEIEQLLESYGSEFRKRYKDEAEVVQTETDPNR